MTIAPHSHTKLLLSCIENRKLTIWIASLYANSIQSIECIFFMYRVLVAAFTLLLHGAKYRFTILFCKIGKQFMHSGDSQLRVPPLSVDEYLCNIS